MSGGILAAAMLLSLATALLAGFPAAFTLGGVALLYALIALLLQSSGLLPPLIAWGDILLASDRIQAMATNPTLLAVPLFAAMGAILDRSGVADDLIQAMHRAMARRRSGNALAALLSGILLALAGSLVGATVAATGRLCANNNCRRSLGAITAAGALGQIIPPSIVLVLLADSLGSAQGDAAQSLGDYATAPIGVPDLFAAALAPGLLLALLFLLYCRLVPASARGTEAAAPPLWASAARVLALAASVLGPLFLAEMSIVEAAACGAAASLWIGATRDRTPPLVWAGGAAMLALVGLRLLGPLTGPQQTVGLGLAILALVGWLNALGALHARRDLLPAARTAVLITAIIFTILLGTSLFLTVFQSFGGLTILGGALAAMPGGLPCALLMTLVSIIALARFLDYVQLLYLVVPLAAPALLQLGAEPLALGVAIALVVQMGLIMPPNGLALAYLRQAAPGMPAASVWKGIAPYLGIQLVVLLLVLLIAPLTQWLPAAMNR